MLYANNGKEPRTEVVAATHPAEELSQAIWLDLLNATDVERSLVERATGLRVPAKEELAEIESSSRLSTEHGALYLSAPMHVVDDEGVPRTAPVGFVLSHRYLMTVRYIDASIYGQFAHRFAGHEPEATAAQAFLGLLEAVVDRLADVLEGLGRDLDTISHRVFRPDMKGANPAKTDVQLRATLRAIGRTGDRLSNLRDSLHGIQRIAQYATDAAADLMPAALRPRLITLRTDIVSLNDFDAQMSNKVQFMLDATLGFINMEQNNSIKVLTVVSVVGVPPTLVASIYGMNFKWIPELQWEYGYFYGLGVIVASAVLPLVWFKKKGWI